LANRLAHQQAPLNPSGFQITATAASFSGPLPPPEILVRYNEAVPGGAERILAMAERQSQHRQDLENRVIEANCRVQRTGPVYGFIICMTAILSGVYLVATGKNVAGIAAIVSSLASLATVFVIGKQKQKKELEEKAAAIVPAK
jgi:uncharacterized membrane protein